MRLIILYTVSPLACFLHISYDDTQHLGCPAPGSAHCRCPAAGERPGPAALDQWLDGLMVVNGGKCQSQIGFWNIFEVDCCLSCLKYVYIHKYIYIYICIHTYRMM